MVGPAMVEDQPMPRDPNRDHYDRPSWKEIDSKKDGRSSGSTSGASVANTKERQRSYESAKKDYLKSIETMFSGSTSYKEDFTNLRIASKTGEFDAAAKRFVEQHGAPEDFEVLMLLLDASDYTVLSQVIAKMAEIIIGENHTRKELFQGKIRLLKLMTQDPRVEKLLEKY